MVRTSARHRAVAATVGVTMMLALGQTAQAAPVAPVPNWVTTQGTAVHLTIIAGWNATNSGFNFNGAAHGQMVVRVPLGDTVTVTFTNNAPASARMLHNVELIPYTMPLPGGGMKLAFPGATSPLPDFTHPSSGKPQSFSFSANKAGTYMLICGVGGHALAGMWDTLVVSPSVKTASVSFNQAKVPEAPATTTVPAKTPTWVSTAAKVVHLSLISGWNADNAGFNFNGASHGKMVVTIPLGDKVITTYKNAVAQFHDVDIIPMMAPLPSHSAPPAFPGSFSPLPSFGKGAPPAQAPIVFSFVAAKAGTYMIICGVPGHALAGMWDTLVISKTATAASVTYIK